MKFGCQASINKKGQKICKKKPNSVDDSDCFFFDSVKYPDGTNRCRSKEYPGIYMDPKSRNKEYLRYVFSKGNHAPKIKDRHFFLREHPECCAEKKECKYPLCNKNGKMDCNIIEKSKISARIHSADKKIQKKIEDAYLMKCSPIKSGNKRTNSKRTSKRTSKKLIK